MQGEIALVGEMGGLLTATMELGAREGTIPPWPASHRLPDAAALWMNRKLDQREDLVVWSRCTNSVLYRITCVLEGCQALFCLLFPSTPVIGRKRWLARGSQHFPGGTGRPFISCGLRVPAAIPYRGRGFRGERFLPKSRSPDRSSPERGKPMSIPGLPRVRPSRNRHWAALPAARCTLTSWGLSDTGHNRICSSRVSRDES